MTSRFFVLSVAFGVGCFLLTRVLLGAGPQHASTAEEIAQTGDPDAKVKGSGANSRASPAAYPTVEFHEVPVALSEEKQMVQEYGGQAIDTWGRIDEAAREVWDLSVARGLDTRPTRLASDCMRGESWGPVHYSLAVASTKDRLTVGEFRVAQGSMPNTMSACLEEFFSGEATRESRYVAGQEASGFLEFATTLHRDDGLFIENSVDAVALSGRDAFVEKLRKRLEVFRKHQDDD